MSSTRDLILELFETSLEDLHEIWRELQPLHDFKKDPYCTHGYILNDAAYQIDSKEKKESVLPEPASINPYNLDKADQIGLLCVLSALIQITQDIIDSIKYCEVYLINDQKNLDSIKKNMKANLALIRVKSSDLNSLYYVDKISDETSEIKGLNSTEAFENLDKIIQIDHKTPLNEALFLSQDATSQLNEMKILPPLPLSQNNRANIPDWRPLLFRSFPHQLHQVIENYRDVTSFNTRIIDYSQNEDKQSQHSLMLHAEHYQYRSQAQEVTEIYSSKERGIILHKSLLAPFVEAYQYVKTQKDIRSFAADLRENSNGECIDARTRLPLDKYLKKLKVPFFSTLIERVYKKNEPTFFMGLAHLIETIWGEAFASSPQYGPEKNGIIDIHLYPKLSEIIESISQGEEKKKDDYIDAMKSLPESRKMIFLGCLLQDDWFLKKMKGGNDDVKVNAEKIGEKEEKELQELLNPLHKRNDILDTIMSYCNDETLIRKMIELLGGPEFLWGQILYNFNKEWVKSPIIQSILENESSTEISERRKNYYQQLIQEEKNDGDCEVIIQRLLGDILGANLKDYQFDEEQTQDLFFLAKNPELKNQIINSLTLGMKDKQFIKNIAAASQIQNFTSFLIQFSSTLPKELVLENFKLLFNVENINKGEALS